MKTLLAIALVASFGLADTGKYEISKYRFSKKSGKSGERLVIEFSTKNKGSKPQVKTQFNSSNKSVAVHIDNASLMGAIPEAMINDTYLPKSNYLGNLNINTDDKESFHLKVALKNSVKDVDAFWLDSPARLVLDISTGGGHSTAKGDHSYSSRGIASEEKRSTKSGKVMCFHADSQVTPAIMFDKKLGIQGQQNGAADGIVCYPTSALVDINVTYLNKQGAVWNSRTDRNVAAVEHPTMMAPEPQMPASPFMAPPPMPAPAQETMLAPPPMPAGNSFLAPPPASSALMPPPAPAEASASPMLLAPPPAN
jgi:hypothetical protein